MANTLALKYGTKEYLNICNLDEKANEDLKNNLIKNINKEIDDNYDKHMAIKHYKDTYKFIPPFVLIGMTNIPYQSDLEYLKGYSEDLGVPFVHYETFFDPSTDTRKSPCFLCSWNRRKALFTVAKEQGCNKIALGHHMDDILETLLMNITFQGAFSTMPPKLVMRKFEMTIIRPMCLVHEADLIEMARIRGFRKQIKDCPYESLSNRSNMKEVLYSLEKMNPEARYSLWKCMTNIQEELLPGMNEHDL